MKHTWRCDIENGKNYIEYGSEEMVLDALLDDFRNYLQGCGYCFNVTDELVKINNEEEQELSNFVYVVTMERWGSIERDSYVIGVYSTFEQAKEAGDLEAEFHGDSYKHHIQRVKMNSLFRDYEEEL